MAARSTARKRTTTRKKTTGRKKAGTRKKATTRKKTTRKKATSSRKKTGARKKATTRKKSTGARKKSASKRKYSRGASENVREEMHEFKRGKLRSGPGGKGGKVKSRKQAIAIGLSEARASGKKVPKRKGGRKKKS
jgi:hypothetical protein